jgi:EAL domain-containing protein (putative c-di-GMP-specific phosphodiesterase class I)
MYHAKARTGSAFRFYDASMNDAALERLELEHEIRRGIEQREFVVYYQPIVEAATRDIVGVEALVRWQHPERGLVGPDDFIPVAEETGLIVRLGEQILSTACIEMRSLAEEGHGPLRLSVNLSVRQLADPGLVSRVREVLVASGWPPSQLVLEITESMLMSPDPESNALLRSLRELGAALSIDDFGSGYSSLSYLKNFEVDHLKIDRTFVSELEQSQNDAEITAAILAMAQGLRLGVVAEGVETEGQLAYLRDRGCDWLQGYLFSPPIPLEDLRKFLVDPTRA